MEFDAIVLAGGRARRLAGADKPAELVGGRRLLDIALDAVSGAEQIVVVGPDREVPAGVVTTREDPPYGGPVAALAAGFAALSDSGARPVVVLASDLPEISASQIGALVESLETGTASAVFAGDSAGHPQYLLGVWRPHAVEAAVTARPDSSMRSVLPTDSAFVDLHDVDDVDTTEDLARARRRAATPDPVAGRARLRATLEPLAPHVGPIADAVGAVLAEPLVAAAAFPPFDASAMDGYAVSGRSPWSLVDTPRTAGHHDTPPLRDGDACPIATGALLPDGADRVVRHEEVRIDGDTVSETSTGRDDTRRTGSAWPAGATLAAAGLAVDAAVCSVARAARTESATVRGPLRATLYTSGDEVVPGYGPDLPVGCIPDTASGPVGDLLVDAGVRVQSSVHLADDPTVFTSTLTGDGADLIVIIGATGHGAADHLRGALANAGADTVLDGIALRPGGSLIVARIPGGPVVLGLGGNPLAAVAGTAVTLPAIIDALLARTPRNPEILDVTGDEIRLPERWRVLPVEPDGTGRWAVTTGRGTGHLLSAIGHRGLALIPPLNASAAVERLS